MEPQFHSQHSHEVLNVSEDHYSSIPCSPKVEKSAKTQVDRSPAISQHEHREPDTAERVDDSYERSPLRDRAPRSQTPFDADDDENLYCVSPKGKAKLDARIATISAQKKRAAILPARDLINDFLEVGAVAESLSKQADGNQDIPLGRPHLAAPIETQAYATTTKSDHRPSANNERKPLDFRVEHHKSSRFDGSTQAAEGSRSGKAPQPQSRNLSTAKAKAITDTTHSQNQSLGVKDASRPKPQSATNGNKSSIKGSTRNKDMRKGGAAISSLDNVIIKQRVKPKPKLAEHSNPGRGSMGRPHRQAKQTALDKLKAKRRDKDDEYDLDSDDNSEQGVSNTIQQIPGAKSVANRGRPSKQLPTPITIGNISDNIPVRHLRYKLRNVNPNPSTTAKPAAKGKLSATEDASAQSETSHETDTPRAQHRAEESKVNSKDSKARNEKEAPQVPQSRKRPGALKRPARSESRGRKAVQEEPYELLGLASRKVKKGRRSSTASRAPSVKPGPTRQKMQSVSVKERTGPKNTDTQSPVALEKAAQAVAEASAASQAANSLKRKKGDSHVHLADTKHDAQYLGESNVSSKSTYTNNVPPSNEEFRSTTLRQRPGSSQANAITIEQDVESSSSPMRSPGSPKRPLETHAGAESDFRQQITPSRPQTPVRLPSSPPGSARVTSPAYVRDKPTIIAFGKQGPRNQGIASARKHAGPRVSSKPPSRSGVGALEPTETVPPKSPAYDQTSTKDEKKPATVSSFEGSLLAGKPFSEYRSEMSEPQKDDKLSMIDDFEGTTLADDGKTVTEHRTASQIAMPPPNKASKKARTELASDGNRIFVPINKTANDTSSSNMPHHMPQTERNVPIVIAEGDEIDASKIFMQEILSAKPANSSKYKRKRDQDLDSEVKPIFERTRAPQTGGQSMPTLASIHPAEPAASQLPSAKEALPTDPIKRADRRRDRTSRRMTGGFSGVDILGSPYPKDLDVPARATALEVVSYQSGLSSDEPPLSLSEDMPPEFKLTAISKFPLLTTTGPVSSNGEPIPASPQNSQKAVSRIASGSLAQKLLEMSRMQTANGDSFTRPTGHVVSPGHHASRETEFEKALHRHGLSDIRRAHRTSQGQQDDDGHKTLVEKDLPQHSASPSSVADSAASNVSIASAATKALHDVGDWRNTLKPHQVHLFDSLVVASHKLVRHLVESETAQHDIVADYYRRGDIIVTELHKAHAREYQQYFENMKTWKKQAADNLAAQGRALRLKMKEAERAKVEREKAKRSWAEVDDALGELLAGLS